MDNKYEIHEEENGFGDKRFSVCQPMFSQRGISSVGFLVLSTHKTLERAQTARLILIKADLHLEKQNYRTVKVH